MSTFLNYLLIFAAIGLFLYTRVYFYLPAFASVKGRISDYVDECNELNEHIRNLKGAYTLINKTDYGSGTIKNKSKYKYQKKAHQNFTNSETTYDCTLNVFNGAKNKPFEYLCKYFHIPKTENTLNILEDTLNKFSAAEEGKILLRNKREDVIAGISDEIPLPIKILCKKRLQKFLGFDEYQFDEFYFPTYSFRYTSAGGNAGQQFDIVMDLDMLERFEKYVADCVSKSKSATAQRRLMTPKFRQYIINRDNCTCKLCGNSTYAEPNLLLEVDHILPVSKGGLTVEGNLQTLCWKCNRHKGNRT